MVCCSQRINCQSLSHIVLVRSLPQNLLPKINLALLGFSSSSPTVSKILTGQYACGTWASFLPISGREKNRCVVCTEYQVWFKSQYKFQHFAEKTMWSRWFEEWPFPSAPLLIDNITSDGVDWNLHDFLQLRWFHGSEWSMTLSKVVTKPRLQIIQIKTS